MSDQGDDLDLDAPRELTPLKAKRLKLHTQRESIAIVNERCTVARSEGLTERARVELRIEERQAIARLYQVDDTMVATDEIGLSETAWQKLGLNEGDELTLHHPRSISSLGGLRRKVYGHRLSAGHAAEIFRDIVDGRLSDVQISAFISALASQPPEVSEIVALTQAMVAIGDRLTWPDNVVVDKHCVGGLPGNRTTPIVVSIVAAAGLTIPKTSSRAITSPAGTADTLATLTRVDLSGEEMRQVVEQQGGCMVWGGGVELSPADDLVIRVERELELDCTSQMVASVMSKKIAAGSTHVLIDVPVGPTAKVRSQAGAEELAAFMKGVGEAFGLHVETIITDGLQPIGDGIGPALEAHDVLAVLECERNAPRELRQRALNLAAVILEMGAACPPGQGKSTANAILDDGRAMRKFVAICKAQGEFRRPERARFQHVIECERSARIASIDNRRLARLAKLAGAPRSPAAGVVIHVNIGDPVEAGQPLITLHGESIGELEYALDYYRMNTDLIEKFAK
ncbi:thymidine phosphorylase family protein [Altererythrobacter lutimaris]|uniref:Putative thymidine phosphorylase n=1 Tax=Altererythrobacter lutimaris TaxID=2743979 RepID=A0A850HA02_9SPHN|nr:thymidine phosphorylase family protein [Altererythrobacter lutimaris]NVE95997.1 thymidine phosphorylase family protein [Altererythrobacter lutimaris]